ncbi:hypothetical protein OPV22_029715 [Ensete ventricosum]|uniref:CBF1-interacting co-repressor CIR N-terminal domain-containing protein n=1 Tax=Ensete ventricosum TaxID=4639 RepID=A0AAV8QBZ3_ENSVE|nr:hypothetical protein OPV22_029715 [Ensete ventricosum]
MRGRSIIRTEVRGAFVASLAERGAVGVDNTFRRKWNREEFLQRARERERQEDEEFKFKSKEKAPPVQRKPLKHRNYEVDLDPAWGKLRLLPPLHH